MGYVRTALSQSAPHASALVRPGASIALDGRLDEPIWREAQPLTLTQQSPKPGAATPYETSVRIIVANDRIFVPRSAISSLTVLGVVGIARRKPAVAAIAAQPKLFSE